MSDKTSSLEGRVSNETETEAVSVLKQYLTVYKRKITENYCY
ncbi:hypothetical protein GCM10009347_26890 [Shewanella algicola]|nr:hypothetical protein GCM10009347_26890 [Shewanella algicola]